MDGTIDTIEHKALGAGIAQGGVRRGLDLATAAAQAERNLQAQQVNHAHVFNALKMRLPDSVTFLNPFNFGHADLQAIQIWNKLLQDPRPLQSNPFYRHEPDYENPPAEMLTPEPMSPPAEALFSLRNSVSSVLHRAMATESLIRSRCYP